MDYMICPECLSIVEWDSIDEGRPHGKWFDTDGGPDLIQCKGLLISFEADTAEELLSQIEPFLQAKRYGLTIHNVKGQPLFWITNSEGNCLDVNLQWSPSTSSSIPASRFNTPCSAILKAFAVLAIWPF